MNVVLIPHSQELLSQQLEQGHYRSAEEVIERALEMLSARDEAARAIDLAEFEAALDVLAQGSGNIPDPPDEAFRRENIYRKHD